MKTILKTFTFLLIFIAVSCSQYTKEQTKEIYVKRIDSLEKKLMQASNIDQMAAKDLIANYSAYAENFPTDSVVPDYLFKAGEIANSIKESERAIQIFGSIVEKYPNYKKAHYCLFLQAFIYENELHNLEKAREYYIMVIEKYPNELIANDAKVCISNLGKSDEELIREFEEKNKQGS